MSTAVNVNMSHVPGVASDKPGRGLTIALWIAQILLALVFGFAGAMKVFTPIEELAKNGAWMRESEVLIRFIGISEVSGALGMLLPSLSRDQTQAHQPRRRGPLHHHGSSHRLPPDARRSQIHSHDPGPRRPRRLRSLGPLPQGAHRCKSLGKQLADEPPTRAARRAPLKMVVLQDRGWRPTTTFPYTPKPWAAGDAATFLSLKPHKGWSIVAIWRIFPPLPHARSHQVPRPGWVSPSWLSS